MNTTQFLHLNMSVMADRHLAIAYAVILLAQFGYGAWVAYKIKEDTIQLTPWPDGRKDMIQAHEMMLMQTMSEQQRMLFMSQMGQVRKDGTVGVLLALFLGSLGAHRFYLNQVGIGIVYVLFCWTFIPSFIALVECFLMSSRVQRYNMEQANLLATQIGAAFPNG